MQANGKTPSKSPRFECPPAVLAHAPSIRAYYLTLWLKKGCLRASDGVMRLSGLRARHRSSKSIKWLSSLVSESVMPLDAAMRRVRRSRVGLTTGRVLTDVCRESG